MIPVHDETYWEPCARSSVSVPDCPGPQGQDDQWRDVAGTQRSLCQAEKKENTRQVFGKEEYAYNGATALIDKGGVPREEIQDFDRCPSSRPEE
jgi:hypothetical protein